MCVSFGLVCRLTMISGQVRLYLTAEVIFYQQKLQFNHKSCDPCVEDFVGQNRPHDCPIMGQETSRWS